MATPAQITANQLNAQRSTGPKTADGKRSSSRNATLHGLSAATFRVLMHEDQVEYERLESRLINEYAPVTQYEEFLVEQLARTWWLLARAQRFHAMALDLLAGSAVDESDPDVVIVMRMFESNPGTLYTLERHVDKAEKSFYRAQRELRSAQRNRKEYDAQHALDAPQVELPKQPAPVSSSALTIELNEPNSDDCLMPIIAAPQQSLRSQMPANLALCL